MNIVTLYRCGLVWFVCALFLYDGGKLIRAQDVQPIGGNGSVKNEEGDDVAARFSVPDWFVPDSQFSEQSRMLFVNTHEPHDSKSDARLALGNESILAIHHALREWKKIKSPETIEIRSDYVFENFVYDGHLEFKEDFDCNKAAENIDPELKFYVGYVQLYLDDQFESYVNTCLKESRTQERLVKSGLVGASILALLVLVFGYLKLETATRGFYSRRLQTGSVIVAVVMMLLVYLIGQQLV